MPGLRKSQVQRYAMNVTLASRCEITREGLTVKEQILLLASPDALKRDRWLSTFKANISTHPQCLSTARTYSKPSPLTTDCRLAGICDLEQPAGFVRLRPMLPSMWRTGRSALGSRAYGGGLTEARR